ncbi:Uncharacterized protein AB751O23_AP_00130 [Chlamydiales bacterium SCGC AB-751-O23]|jgi:phosphatidylserine/phosphatidylglycerophosphate/cardiolipin synthase-like enzyme|nr:Uncharacterized protein AB751O23_AP_00130 [Chlamydiales bacterium SCGC AB-751-O23]
MHQKNSFSTLKAFSWLCLLSFLIGALYFLISPFSVKPYEPVSPEKPQQLYSRLSLDAIDQLFIDSLESLKKGRLYIFSLSASNVWEKSLSSLKTKDFQILYDKKYGQKIARFPQENTLPYPKSYMMHCKILTYDDQCCVIGSANLTPSSLKKDHNLVMSLYNPSLAKWLFNHFHNPKELTYIDDEIEFYMLPKNPLALTRLEKAIEEAKKTVQVAMFTFTHADLAKALAKAKKKGIDVEIILEKRQAKSYSQKALNILKESGIQARFLYSQEIMHHKFMLVDHKQLSFGSCNWTNGAFNKNKDAFAIIQLNSENQRKMSKIWAQLKSLSST